MRQCSQLILWTDCDREGENIAQEVVEVCVKGINVLSNAGLYVVYLLGVYPYFIVKRNIQIHRARFSEITPQWVLYDLLLLVCISSCFHGYCILQVCTSGHSKINCTG